MSRINPILLGMTLAVAAGSIAAAQDATPPKVLQITREWLKPGKGGAAHDKSEAAFVAASNHGKLQGHYVALNSISGKARALYVYSYPSMVAMEEDQKIIDKNAALTAEFDRASMNDGELLDGIDTGVFTYDEDVSYHPHPDVSHARYYEITVFHMRPGHHKEWYQVSKMYKDTLDKAGSSSHWAAYEAAYGAEAGTFIAITARNSLAEIDHDMADFKKVMEAAGGYEGMDKIDQMFEKAVDSSRSELFSVNPKQSYPEESWIKADPDFWKPKAKAPEAAAAKPAATKPTPAAAKPGGN